ASTCRRTCSTRKSRTERGGCSTSELRTKRAEPSPLVSHRPRRRRSASKKSQGCRARKRSRRSQRAPAATRRTSASGCAASRASLWSLPTVLRRRPPLKSSTWHAHGNIYLVHDGPATPADAEGTDGVVEVLAVDGDEIT